MRCRAQAAPHPVHDSAEPPLAAWGLHLQHKRLSVHCALLSLFNRFAILSVDNSCSTLGSPLPNTVFVNSDSGNLRKGGMNMVISWEAHKVRAGVGCEESEDIFMTAVVAVAVRLPEPLRSELRSSQSLQSHWDCGCESRSCIIASAGIGATEGNRDNPSFWSWQVKLIVKRATPLRRQIVTLVSPLTPLPPAKGNCSNSRCGSQ